MIAREPVPLSAVARLPAPGDNAAIAITTLEPGTVVGDAGAGAGARARHYALPHAVLEGHRFAVRSVPVGDALLSWGLPFGYASRAITPGEYLVNARMLAALRERGVPFALPEAPNFADRTLTPYHLDEAAFVPGAQVAPTPVPGTFAGYRRGGGPGVGTRNYVVVLGLTSRSGAYARALADRLHGLADAYPEVDGIVPVAHTEGGAAGTPNNLGLLLRTLAGFAVHPNVGAVLLAGHADGAVSLGALRGYMAEHGYPLAAVPHDWLALGAGWEEDVRRGEALIRARLPEANAAVRALAPLSELRLALQCGGSDAFSGVSGNPLAAWAAKELIRHGGAANLAETDELVGAESYLLANVRDLATARAFLRTVAQFKELVGRHGHTAEENPSGGNLYRGLYNITIKSIGAAMKRDPEVRLDRVIAYGERIAEPGYHFMDSPGNDLESVAGQVASGCTVIHFVTGNGSITNFPFVPTIKVVTTTRRHELLRHDMDVNAGAYLDGAPMDTLGAELFARTVRVAAGERTAGERAGHAQVSIWRDWARPEGSAPPPVETSRRDVSRAAEPDGAPVAIGHTVSRAAAMSGRNVSFPALETASGAAADQVGLVLPTSLCSGQIARIIADRLNREDAGRGRLSRFVALPHTEGCGVSAGSAERLYTRTLIGYLTHPLVGRALLLEHGCEKTHNDYLRNQLEAAGVDPGRFGWASVQLDGGIGLVAEKVTAWFRDAVAALPEPTEVAAGLDALRLGLASAGPVGDPAAASLLDVARSVAEAGGAVVVPSTATFLRSTAWRDGTGSSAGIEPTLAYGQRAERAGLHIMDAPSEHWIETLTGLGATGVEVVLLLTGEALSSHRLVPVLQVGAGDADSPDLDLVLAGDPAGWAEELLGLVLAVAGRRYVPRLHALGATDFQFTRGPLGVSM